MRRDPSRLRVRDCMFSGVISCAPEAGLLEVASIMRDRHIRAVVVMEDGHALGVISQTDLVNAAFVEPFLHHWRGLAARHLMTSPVISVPPDAPLTEALALLEARRIHRVLVMEATPEGERPVGVLSATDVAHALAGAGARVRTGRRK